MAILKKNRRRLKEIQGRDENQLKVKLKFWMPWPITQSAARSSDPPSGGKNLDLETTAPASDPGQRMLQKFDGMSTKGHRRERTANECAGRNVSKTTVSVVNILKSPPYVR